MSRRLEVGLVLLLALAVGLATWTGRRRAGASPDFDSRTSSFLSGPQGSRAAYDVLARLGVPVERRRTPLFDLAESSRHRPAVLAVLDPPLDLEAAELAQVARFVRAGGVVVVAGSGGGITRCVGWVAANAARLLRVDSFPVQPPEPGLDLPPVADYLRPPGVEGGGPAGPAVPRSGCAAVRSKRTSARRSSRSRRTRCCASVTGGPWPCGCAIQAAAG